MHKWWIPDLDPTFIPDPDPAQALPQYNNMDIILCLLYCMIGIYFFNLLVRIRIRIYNPSSVVSISFWASIDEKSRSVIRSTDTRIRIRLNTSRIRNTFRFNYNLFIPLYWCGQGHGAHPLPVCERGRTRAPLPGGQGDRPQWAYQWTATQDSHGEDVFLVLPFP